MAGCPPLRSAHATDGRQARPQPQGDVYTARVEITRVENSSPIPGELI
jgi:hypothetical protein